MAEKIQLSENYLIKGQSIVSLLPLYRVRNTNTLLCACHQETEAGLEEEEEEHYFILFLLFFQTFM